MLLYPLGIGRARQTPLGVLINHHIQDRYLLHYVAKGEVWHEFHNQTYVARTGDACLMDLSEYIARPAGESRSADIYWVTFNGKDASRCFAELRADRDPVFFALNPSVMEGIFRELLRQTAHEDIASEWRADGLLKLLFAELYAVRAHGQLGRDGTSVFAGGSQGDRLDQSVLRRTLFSQGVVCGGWRQSKSFHTDFSPRDRRFAGGMAQPLSP